MKSDKSPARKKYCHSCLTQAAECGSQAYPCPFRLDSQRVPITGGGTGLGLAMARCMVDAGASVILTRRRDTVLRQTVASLGPQAGCARHDVTRLKQSPTLIAKVQKKLGPVTILVNNAGVHLKKPAVETTEEELLQVLSIHVLGTHALSRDFTTGYNSQKGRVSMKPTDILSQEHRVIEQVLNCLERIAQRCRDDGALDAQAARDALEFFRNFADCCHHGKEESHFFPAMEAKGFSRESGPTGVMLREHELGRGYVRQMNDALHDASHDPGAKDHFVNNAVSYIGLLREHIRKEDHCLFPMADRAFSEAEQNQLLETFRHVESEMPDPGAHERYLRLADYLAERCGVHRSTSTPSSGPCGCGHSDAGK
ncbi:MAG: SDR family NAD(P)-dependent oxidoreductase [Pirellulales bacterium]|nr:SDR family NAD(P)-dependent oxidoreductase [Pirellulales bacterium]